MGFNTVKLPFSFDALLKGNDGGIYQRYCTPTNAQTLTNGLTEQSRTVAAGASIPTVSAAAGSCNSYLPSKAMDRFLWVINYFATNGFYVVRVCIFVSAKVTAISRCRIRFLGNLSLCIISCCHVAKPEVRP